MRLIFFKRLILGLITGVLVSAVSLLLFSLILSKQSDPAVNAALFSYLALILGSFSAGKAATLGIDEKLLMAILSALCVTALLFIASAAIKGSFSLAYTKMLISAISAFAGAIVGKKRGSSAPSRKRRNAIVKRYAR